MPEFAFSYTIECWNEREWKTGITTKEGSGHDRVMRYVEKDIYGESKSCHRDIRQNISFTGRVRWFRSMPSGRTRPSR
jgi:hypothetical protein